MKTIHRRLGSKNGVLSAVRSTLSAIVVLTGLSVSIQAENQWPVVGGSNGGQRYADLDQITPDNVNELEVAWTHHSGDFSAGAATHGPTAFQATPIMVDDTLYYCTPFNNIIALDPITGTQKWRFDSNTNLLGVYTPVCRGVAYWSDSEGSGACAERIIMGTVDARLVAVDANTGEACAAFGDNGIVNLLNNLGDVRLAEYYVTSTPLVSHDLIITGAFVQDGQRVDSPPGVIRAFDARTGALRWAFDPVPPGVAPVSAEAANAGENFTRRTPNAWGLLSANEELGLVYVPTGGSQPDHYGGLERGNMDHYGTSVVALNINTGTPQWQFQAVHHDIWDYDIAAQPVTFQHRGDTPGVIAATKMGHIFLLNGASGEPLFPVEERPVPQTTLAGEYTSPTQPFPTLPKPVHGAEMTEDDIWGFYPGDRDECLEAFRSMHYEGIFTPPLVGQKTLEWPGLGGGINWGSVSVNPKQNIMLVNSMRVPYIVEQVPRDQVDNLDGTDLVGASPQEGTPYVALRAGFVSSNNTPCNAPPWGVLTAIQLDSGDTLWEKPLGNLSELSPLGLGYFFEWGTPNTGGTLQTASGLVFVGATLDAYFRAYDVQTGDKLWQVKMPAPAQATPMSFVGRDGNQYVVIAAGGHGPLAYAAKGPEKLGEMLSDALVAYRLPKP